MSTRVIITTIASIAEDMQGMLDISIKQGRAPKAALLARKKLIDDLNGIIKDLEIIPYPEIGRIVGQHLSSLIQSNQDVDGTVIEVHFKDKPRPEYMVRDLMVSMPEIRASYGLSK